MPDLETCEHCGGEIDDGEEIEEEFDNTVFVFCSESCRDSYGEEQEED